MLSEDCKVHHHATRTRDDHVTRSAANDFQSLTEKRGGPMFLHNTVELKPGGTCNMCRESCA